MHALPPGLVLLACLAGPLAASPADPPGRRFEALEGSLFLPEGLVPRGNEVDLVLHFQGERRAVEAGFQAARLDAVLYTSNLKGLSETFRGPFRDPGHLGAILADAAAKLAPAFGLERIRIGRLGIASFSAGFGAVRELLASPAWFDRIDLLVMADSLYASFLAPDLRVPPVEQMAGFMRFAQAAAAGRKVMVVTHGQYKPEGYCGTGETAPLLLAAVGGRPEPAGGGETRCDVGGFHLLGCARSDPQHHGECLRQVGGLLARYGPQAGFRRLGGTASAPALRRALRGQTYE